MRQAGNMASSGATSAPHRPPERRALTSRERVARCLARKPHDRVPVFDWWWMETEIAYLREINDPRIAYEFSSPGVEAAHVACRGEGLTLWEYFDMDLLQVGWPDQRLRMVDPVVIEESDDWVIQRDGNDATLRWWKHRMGTPEHLGYGIDSPEKWRAAKESLTPARERIRWAEFLPKYRRARRDERFVCYTSVEIIESVKDSLGHEQMLRAMIKRPEWLHDVFDTYTTFLIDMFELAVAGGLACDGAFIYGDIAYKNGPFMSPRHYREFVQPYHRRLFDAFHARSMPVMFHSDGDIRPILDDLIAAGVDMINPLESRAGMDVRELAPRVGDRVGFCGNIDVTVLATNDREQIRAEIESKMRAAMAHHGYMYHSDHSIPPGVRLDTYRFVLDEVRRIGRYS